MKKERKKSPLVSPVVKIHVTAETINASQERNSSHCMIAESIKASVPDAAFVAVDMLTIRWSDPTKGLRYTYLTPRTVARAIINFDQGIIAQPFNFQLRSAAQIRRTGWRASHPNTERRSDLKKKTRGTRKITYTGGTVKGGDPIPQMSTRREFGARLFVR